MGKLDILAAKAALTTPSPAGSVPAPLPFIPNVPSATPTIPTSAAPIGPPLTMPMPRPRLPMGMGPRLVEPHTSKDGQGRLLGSSKLQAFQAIREQEDGGYDGYAEINRIVSMPVVEWMTKEEHEAYCRINMMAAAFDRSDRLFETQSNAGATFDQFNCGFFPIGVGWGKTLIDLMVAVKAYQKGEPRPMLMVPSAVLGQLVDRDIAWIRTMIPVTIPINVVAGRPTEDRKAMARSGKKGLYILTYPLLSTKDTDYLLEAISPGLIIADEIHNLAKMSAARTRRFMQFVAKRGCAGVGLSGTITSKSVNDYWHLIRWCLGENNPLPNSANLAREWGAVIDADATLQESRTGEATEPEDIKARGTGPLVPLIKWAVSKFGKPDHYSLTTEGFRMAFKDRLRTTPGVVASGDAELGVSLTICNRPVPDHEKAPGWPELEKLIDQINDQWLTPNGDTIDHAIHTWKWLYELSAGFYNELTWPTPDKYAKRKQIAEDKAAEILEKAVIHHAAGQEYHKYLRKWFETGDRTGMDTPMLVGNEMARNGAKNVGGDLFDLWSYWRSCDFEGRPDRDSRAVRVCDYKIVELIRWLKSDEGPKGKGCLVWVWHNELSEWIYEMLKAAGIDALHCPSGANAQITDPANGNKVIVAMVGSHGTGKNLQHFQHQYYMQFPRGDVLAEQSLGRTHRNGQKADELRVYMNHTTIFDHMNFASCLNDALYIHQTTGNRQKLIYAGYDPLPRIFPPAVLRQRGFELKGNAAKLERAMRDRFAKEA